MKEAYNMFWVTYSTGEVCRVEFPHNWTAAEVMTAERAIEIDGPYPA